MSGRGLGRSRAQEEKDDETASQPHSTTHLDNHYKENNNKKDKNENGSEALLNPVREQELEFQEMLNDAYEMKRLAAMQAQEKDDDAEAQRIAAELEASEKYAIEQQLLEIQKHQERLANRRRIQRMSAEQRQREARELLAAIQEQHEQTSAATAISGPASRRGDVGDSPPRQYQSSRRPDDRALAQLENNSYISNDLYSLPSSIPREIPVPNLYHNNYDEIENDNSIVPRSDLTSPPSRYRLPPPPSVPVANHHRYHHRHHQQRQLLNQEQSILEEGGASHHLSNNHNSRAISNTQEQQESSNKDSAAVPWYIRYYILILVILVVLLLIIISTTLGMVVGRNNNENNNNSNNGLSNTNGNDFTQPPTSTNPVNSFKAFESTDELYQAVDDYLLVYNNNGDGTASNNDNTQKSSQVSITCGSPIGTWNVSAITDFSRVFSNSRNPLAATFDQDLDEWDVSSAISMEWMFAGAAAFNGDVSTWTVSSVTSMRGMFYDATAFQRDITAWDLRYVTDTSFMFQYAAAFDRDISQWDVSRVKTMSNMFMGATSFNQDLSIWDVSNVQDMSLMFFGASQFNQSLCEWGNLLPVSCIVTYMFQQTACPMALEDPQLVTTSSGAPGPFCCECA